MNYQQFIESHETAIRLGCFVTMFIATGAWEIMAPRRTLSAPKKMRWTSNLGLVVLNTGLLRLLFPLAAVGVAASAAAHDWGLLNHFQLPIGITVLLAVIALDLAVWLQHVLFHAVPVLWRLHSVHHADPDFDLTTGSRFHPIEIVLSMLIKFVAIAAIGPPVVAVVIFEVMLNATAMFNHGNVRLPLGLDAIARWLVVTPDMHRVHHSIDAAETNSNFGFNLPWWDRLFGTYCDQPLAGHTAMTIGLRGQANLRQVARLDGMLLLPFKQQANGYVINRRGGADKPT